MRMHIGNIIQGMTGKKLEQNTNLRHWKSGRCENFLFKESVGFNYD